MMADTKPVAVEDSTFESVVENSKGISVVDFWAEWCGPCKMMGAVLEELAGEYSGKVNFFKLDVESSKKTAQRFNVRAIPTLVFFKDGKAVQTVIGFKSKKELTSLLEKQTS